MFAKRFIEFINISVLFNVVLAVRESGQAKCAFSFVTGTAVCEDVNSFHEIAHEIRSTWINIKINNRLGGSFAMVIRGMYWTTSHSLTQPNDYVNIRRRTLIRVTQ